MTKVEDANDDKRRKVGYGHRGKRIGTARDGKSVLRMMIKEG